MEASPYHQVVDDSAVVAGKSKEITNDARQKRASFSIVVPPVCVWRRLGKPICACRKGRGTRPRAHQILWPFFLFSLRLCFLAEGFDVFRISAAEQSWADVVL